MTVDEALSALGDALEQAARDVWLETDLALNQLDAITNALSHSQSAKESA